MSVVTGGPEGAATVPGVSSDNWPTHGQTHTCRYCQYFVPKVNEVVGRCRRHAPTMAGFPVVYPTDTCGDHKLLLKGLRETA